MATFINSVTEQIVEIGDDLRKWFLESVADVHHWIEKGSDAAIADVAPESPTPAEAAVEPAPVATPSPEVPDAA